MSTEWYVLRTEPRAEYQSAEALARDGFEIFLPRVNSVKQRIWRGDTPLFPGYLFIRWEAGTKVWPTFRPVHRVLGWLKFGDVVPSISNDVITELAARVDAINGTNGLWRRFRIGEKVQVVSGPIQGLAKVIQEAKSPQGRATVHLEFLGRLVEAQVPWTVIQPVSDLPKEETRIPRRTRGRGRWVRSYRPTIESSALA